MGLILLRIPPQTPQLGLFFAQLSQTPFWNMYKHETPPTPPQNTIFPGLKLKVGKINCCLGKMDPVLAKCLKIGQFFLEVGKKKYSSSRGIYCQATA